MISSVRTILFMAVPLEMTVARRNGRIKEVPEYHKVYGYIRKYVDCGKVAGIDNVNVGLTEHKQDEDHRILVLVNYDPEPAKVALTLLEGWKVERFLKGTLDIQGNDCTVIEICRE